MATSKNPLSQRYTAWLNIHRRAILGVATLVAALAGYGASTLPVHADFSYLLPEQSESVQHLRALEKRARVLGTAMLVVRSEDPAARHKAADLLHQKLAQLGPEKVSQVTFDRHVGRSFAWENRWLLPSLDQLRNLQKSLPDRLSALRTRGNPLVMDLEVDAPQADVGSGDMEALSAQLKQLEHEKDEPGPYVSPDGHLQMMIVQTPFPAGDIGKDTALLADLQKMRSEVLHEVAQVEIGIAGDVVTSFEEHRSILSGMVSATLITIVLCLGALWAFYGTSFGVLALAASLLVGTLMTFTITRLTIGHLNVATAFLASIVLGNGINFGIMLLARYLEALRDELSFQAAMSVALGETVHGTLAAAATAAVAYFSLTITAFRGFFDFGIIAGVGMLLCWASAYTVLPTLLLLFTDQGRIRARQEPAVGRLLSGLMPHRSGLVVTLGLAVAFGAGVVTWDYLSHDPYESNFKNLRSVSSALIEERAWMTAVDNAFGRGISGGFVIGVPHRDDAKPMLDKLRAIDAARPENEKLFSRINALDDYLPQDQPQKREVLATIRQQLSDEVLASLPRAARAKLRALRPPERIPALTDSDIPDAMAWPFIENDGSRGKLILAMSGWGFEIWNSHDIVRYADTMRGLHLGHDVLLGGSTFVFSDMLRFIEQDGPRATLAAMGCAAVVVILVVGLCLETAVTLVCGLIGTLVMLAVVALCGLRVNFLDFVALPITIGIGIDYAVNICARAKAEPPGPHRARRALMTAGGAVCMSSYTTIVGYGSLLMSSNMGIRSFGLAAILGEGTCLVAALLLAPALLDLLSRQRNLPITPRL